MKKKTYALIVNNEIVFEMDFDAKKDYEDCCYELWDYFESLATIQVEGE